MPKISARMWTTLILIGLVGQFAWTIENMYFNVYLYNTISTDPTYIAWMVAASAVAATLTTLIMRDFPPTQKSLAGLLCGMQEKPRRFQKTTAYPSAPPSRSECSGLCR